MSEPQKADFRPEFVTEPMSVTEQIKALTQRVMVLEANQPLPDVDIHGPHGDPTVFNDPKKWEGASYKGKFFSQCPADYLKMLSGGLKFKASKEAEDPAKAKYSRLTLLDAARALAWAKNHDEAPNF